MGAALNAVGCRKPVLGTAAAIAIALFVVAAKPATGAPVIIEKKEPTVERKIFDPENPPEGSSLKEGEDASTSWDFHYGVTFGYEEIAEKSPPAEATPKKAPAEPTPKRAPAEATAKNAALDAIAKKSPETRIEKAESVSLRITRARINLRLPITMWLPKNVDERLLSHEEGHRQIAEEVYQNADKTALSQASVIIGKAYTGTGPSHREAVANALNNAAAELNKEYSRETAQYSRLVSDIYDRLTRHGKNKKPVFFAVREAFFYAGFERHKLNESRVSAPDQ